MSSYHTIDIQQIIDLKQRLEMSATMYKMTDRNRVSWLAEATGHVVRVLQMLGMLINPDHKELLKNKKVTMQEIAAHLVRAEHIIGVANYHPQNAILRYLQAQCRLLISQMSHTDDDVIQASYPALHLVSSVPGKESHYHAE